MKGCKIKNLETKNYILLLRKEKSYTIFFSKSSLVGFHFNCIFKKYQFLCKFFIKAFIKKNFVQGFLDYLSTFSYSFEHWTKRNWRKKTLMIETSNCCSLESIFSKRHTLFYFVNFLWQKRRGVIQRCYFSSPQDWSLLLIFRLQFFAYFV